MTDHTHRWKTTSFRAAFECSHCGIGGWDWQQDEIRRLTADLKLANRGLEQARRIIAPNNPTTSTGAEL